MIDVEQRFLELSAQLPHNGRQLIADAKRSNVVAIHEVASHRNE